MRRSCNSYASSSEINAAVLLQLHNAHALPHLIQHWCGGHDAVTHTLPQLIRLAKMFYNTLRRKLCNSHAACCSYTGTYVGVRLWLHTHLCRSHAAVTHALPQIVQESRCSRTRSAANYIAVLLRWNCYLLLWSVETLLASPRVPQSFSRLMMLRESEKPQRRISEAFSSKEDLKDGDKKITDEQR